MRIAQLLDILRDYPQEWEVELAVIAPVEDGEPADHGRPLQHRGRPALGG